MSPISELPDDLLRHMFALCATDVLTLPPGVAEPRLTICSVCSRWRYLALNSPELWINIKLVGSSRAGDIDQGKEILKTWVMRTSSALLSLEVWSPIPGFNENWMIRPMIDAIIPYATRFRKLRVAITYENAYDLFTMPPGSFPALEYLDLLGYA